MATKPNSHIVLNNEEYEFSIVLSNPDKTMEVPNTLFKSLVVTETLMEWSITGHIDLINNFEQLERITDGTDKKNNEMFYFRMDGTDRINIYLTPTFANSQATSNSRESSKNPLFNAMFLFIRGAIYDTQDLTSSTIENKEKRLYFWDVDYNKAVENTLPISSGEYVREVLSKNPTNLPDAQRAVATGDLLKFLIKNKLGGEVSDAVWDSGKNKIMFNSPATATLADNMEYLVSRHVTDSEYPAILRKNRFTHQFELLPYDSLFASYSGQLKERFTFPDSTTKKVAVGPARAIPSNTYSFGSNSVLTGYEYTKMSGMDNMKAISTKSVNSYNPVSKQFKVSLAKNTAINAKEKFKTIVSNLNASRSTALLPINKTKTLNKSIEHIYVSGAYNLHNDLACGVCKTLKAALFLNDCITFTVTGLPIRTSGNFIEIYSPVDLQGVWEDRFLGAWLTTSVVHVITPTTYMNQIVAVKPNATENFDVPENVEGK